MTAHFVAKVVQSQFDKINLSEVNSEFDGLKKYDCGRLSDEWVNHRIQNKQFNRWMKSCGVFETYLRTNFSTFVVTDLVYEWGKDICDMRSKELNDYRTYGWVHGTFENYLNRKYK